MKLTLTRDQLDNVMYKTEDFDPDVEFHPHYSGRGMFGKQCIGVTADSPATPAAFLYFLAEELGHDYLELLQGLGFGARDSMGLSTIYYWSHVMVEDDEEEEK
jgi:hypothetical protein